MRVIDPLCTSNCFVSHMERDQKPLPGLDRMSEAVFDSQIELRRAEYTVEDVFQTRPVQIIKFVSRDDFHVSQPVVCIFLRACDAGFNLVAGYADLVDQLAVIGYERVIRLTPQHLDCPCCNIIRLRRIAKQRSHVWIGEATTRLILVKRTL